MSMSSVRGKVEVCVAVCAHYPRVRSNPGSKASLISPTHAAPFPLIMSLIKFSIFSSLLDADRKLTLMLLVLYAVFVSTRHRLERACVLPS